MDCVSLHMAFIWSGICTGYISVDHGVKGLAMVVAYLDEILVAGKTEQEH